MNILLIGSGGREHTIAWKLTESPHCSSLFIAPGNAGTGELGINVPINTTDFEALKTLVLEEAIEMVVVGPEEPLVRGIVDFFQKDPDLSEVYVIGPSAEGAKLEGSKAFAKAFMQENNIPTAAYQAFGQGEMGAGLAFIAAQTPPIVLKADGLAAGKGVLILENVEEAQAEFKAMLNGKFGAASEQVVVEQFLKGIEFSVFVLTDGNSYQILPVAKDYKRVGEGDTGLNTGGMGAVSPPPFVDTSLMEKVENRIIQPTLEGLKRRQIDYKGFLFLGLIVVENEPFVIEYNCRLGDPETEVVLPRLQSDFVELLYATANGELQSQTIQTMEQTAATVVLVSGGYPETYEKGKEIKYLKKVKDGLVFHAGTTATDNGKIVTDGGRVLALTSFGASVEEAVKKSIKNADLIDFDKKYFRRDIGFDL